MIKSRDFFSWRKVQMDKVDWEGGVEGFGKRIRRCGLFNRTQLASLFSFIILFLRLTNQKEIHYLKQMRTRGRGESTRAWDWGKNMPNGKDSERAYDTLGVKKSDPFINIQDSLPCLLMCCSFPPSPSPSGSNILATGRSARGCFRPWASRVWPVGDPNRSMVVLAGAWGGTNKTIFGRWTFFCKRSNKLVFFTKKNNFAFSPSKGKRWLKKQGERWILRGRREHLRCFQNGANIKKRVKKFILIPANLKKPAENHQIFLIQEKIQDLFFLLAKKNLVLRKKRFFGEEK